MTIGERVRQLRLGQGLNASELARRSQLPPATVTRVEQGKSSPTSATVEKLARGLDVEPGVLFGAPPKAPTLPPPRTYEELLERAGAEGSGLARPVERDAENNLDALFDGRTYKEAYALYRGIVEAKKAVEETVNAYLQRDLPEPEKVRLNNFLGRAALRSTYALTVAAALFGEERNRLRDDDEALEEMDQLQHQMAVL